MAQLDNQEMVELLSTYFIRRNELVWRDYSPAWTAAGTNPTIGSGILSGRYCRVGKLVAGSVYMTAVADTTYGAGLWTFSLPFPAANEIVSHISSFFAYDDSAGQDYIGITMVRPSATGIYDFRDGGTFTFLTSTIPFTWASGDELHYSFSYEAA